MYTEEIDLLFASDSIWVWNAEKEFQKQKAENMAMTHVGNINNIEAAGTLRRRGDKDAAFEEERVETVV
jgi:hypothetical protein